MPLSDEARANIKLYQKERYEWYKAHGICPRCREQAMVGRVYCAKCFRKTHAHWDKVDKDGSVNRQRCADRRKRLKAAGMCVNCGNAKAVDGKTLCPKCRAKNEESRTNYLIRQKIEREAQKAREQSGKKIRGDLK